MGGAFLKAPRLALVGIILLNAQFAIVSGLFFTLGHMYSEELLGWQLFGFSLDC